VTLSLSVVVCTHNRPADLRRCLDALSEVEGEFDVIVVDSASQPSCRPLVDDYRTRIGSLRYLSEERLGHSRARNRGIADARGDVIAFLDDDAAPHHDWARQIVLPFERDDAIGCVGGACHAVFPDVPRPSWLSDRLLQFAAITRFGPIGREARSSSEWPFGANMAFRRDALLAASPFPERLGRHGSNLLSGDETPVIESVRRHGWKVWLEPSAVVDHAVHVERCQSRYYWRRLWWTGITRARATDASAMLGFRLVAAAGVRLVAFACSWDRVYLYRTAETAGFLAERARLLLKTAP